MKKSQPSHEIIKNSLIWFVLLFAFFPLYVMFAISFKTNTQFLHNPFGITFPFDWQNWVHGWYAIKGYIANSIFTSTISVNSLMGLSVLYTVGGQVFCIFVLRNFIEEIPQDLFEAAQVDGAGPFKQIFNIVIPMSGSILATLAILRFLGCWNDFITPLVFISDEYKQLIPVGLMRLDGEYFTMRLFVKGLSAGAVKG